MSVDVAEIVVRATSEIDDAEKGLDDVEEGVSDAKEEMDDAADSFGDLQKRFTGAFGAIAAGVAASSGFMLQTIPVLQETMSALGASIQSVGLRLDEIIRPAFQRVNDLIFSFADFMHDAEGATGMLANGIAVLAPIVVGIAGALATWAVKAFGVIGALAKLGGAVKIAAGALLTLLKVGVALISWPVALAAGLALLAFMFRSEIANAVGVALDALTDIASWFIDAASDAVNWGADLVRGWASGFMSWVGRATDRVRNLAGRVRDIFTSLVESAVDWGRDLIRRFISGITSNALRVGDAIGGIELAGGVTVGDVAGEIGANVEAGADAGGEFIGGVGNGAANVFLNGRKVSDENGRFSKSRLTRRGG